MKGNNNLHIQGSHSLNKQTQINPEIHMRIKYYSDVHMQKEKQGKELARFRDPRAAEKA